MHGLLSGLDRKNCWTIAEYRGDANPDALQHLLSRARWDQDGVRDDLRGYVLEAFNDPAGILVVDETGDLKKGTRTVGVQRQYTGTAGRIENAQVAVYLTYAAGRGHALIDRALYLPRSWVEDPARCAAAGVPADVEFATKPALALRMDRRRSGRRGGRVVGDPVTRCTATTRRCGRDCGTAGSDMCWRCPATIAFPPTAVPSAPTAWRICPSRVGRSWCG